MNITLAREVIRELAANGVSDYCICPGARNSPLVVVACASPQLTLFTFCEERSASFFALGRARALDRPIAVVTTSGTAAAELLPAVIEAHYTGTPLILITADRPARYRQTGAPQTIEQVGLYGVYATYVADVDAPGQLCLAGKINSGPVHINVCFDEPLVDEPVVPVEGRHEQSSEVSAACGRRLGEASEGLNAFLASVKRPLILLGALKKNDRDEVARFLEVLGAPVHAEAHSGLRGDVRIAHLQLHSADLLLDRNGSVGRCDAVIRIGGVPVSGLWRRLDTAPHRLRALALTDVPFAGALNCDTITVPIAPMLSRHVVDRSYAIEDQAGLFHRDRVLDREVTALLNKERLSEASLVHRLSLAIPFGSSVFLGNSLPIREWEIAATRLDKKFDVGSSRGANGIDGQVSTFLGMSSALRENWAVLGDLTVLCDLSAPWVLPQLQGVIMRIVVINNKGGRIFERMFKERVFQNEHALRFRSWAEMWGLGYQEWPDVPECPRIEMGCVLELRPEADASRRFWDAYDLLREI